MGEWISSTGLLFDIAGVVILFKFHLPKEINRSGDQFLRTELKNTGEIKKAKIYDRLSGTAVALLVFGFVFQIVDDHI